MQIHPPLSSPLSFVPLPLARRRATLSLLPPTLHHWYGYDRTRTRATRMRNRQGVSRHDGIISVRGYKIPDCPVAQRDRGPSIRAIRRRATFNDQRYGCQIFQRHEVAGGGAVWWERLNECDKFGKWEFFSDLKLCMNVVHVMVIRIYFSLGLGGGEGWSHPLDIEFSYYRGYVNNL